MLVFIIPVKSPQLSKSWDHVSKLFERCIRSVCNQTSANFRVIVVCHEKPQIEFSHPHITYIEVDFPPPAPDGKSKGIDKLRKILLGLNYARQLNPSHAMNVDADDCVSKHLAKLVEQNPQSNGWFVDKGYVYEDGSKILYFKRKDFHQWCGTCNIVRYDLIDIPERIEDAWINFKKYYCSHRRLVKKLAQQGTPLNRLPFSGAIYILGHGDNDSGNINKFLPNKGIVTRLKNICFNFRPLPSLVRDEFGIYDLR